jgi:hypothetical protein
MKGNHGRGARRKQTRRILIIVGGGFVVLVIGLMLVLGVGGGGGDSNRRSLSQPAASENGNNKNLRDTPWSKTQNQLTRIRDAAQEQASQFRKDLLDQFARKDEGEILDMVLQAKIHLVDLHIVEEELLRAPSNHYAGVYGSFCKLDWNLHKQDPSAGTCSNNQP